MKTKKEKQTAVRDLRGANPEKVAIPDVSDELAGASASAKGPRIVTPGVRVQTPGQTTHE